MSNSPIALCFSEEDLERREIPIVLNFKTGPRHFILREADGDIACRYKNYFVQRTTLGPNGKPQKVSEAADIGPLLISWCLVETLDKPDGTTQEIGPPKVPDIRTWPPRVLQKLQDTIEEISELGAGEETLESLLEEQEKLQEKITKLQEKGNPVKND